MITTINKHFKRILILGYTEYLLAVVLSSLSLLVMLFDPVSTEWLRYQAVEVSNGQWWRIITANLCHSNWNHWLLNICGLWLMDFFYQPVLSSKMRGLLLLFCMLANVLMLHLWMDLYWYVGLSGALHGYLIGGALLSWNKAPKLNFVIILLTVAKLIIERVWQINSATEALIGANVLEESHSFGAISSVIFWLVYLTITRFSQKPANSSKPL